MPLTSHSHQWTWKERLGRQRRGHGPLHRSGVTGLFEPGTITRDDLSILDRSEAEPPQIPQEWLDDSKNFLRESIARALGLS